MSWRAFTLAMIAGLMAAETRLSRRQEHALRDRGAVEPPGDVYGSMAVLYPAAFLLMGLEGVWRASADAWGAAAQGWYAAGLVMFVAAKGVKYWAIRALGDRWSFRVLVLPGVPLVTSGPYRYLTHPNYVGVAGELVGTAMMMGARIAGPIMVALFGFVLWARIRFENRILASLTGVSR